MGNQYAILEKKYKIRKSRVDSHPLPLSPMSIFTKNSIFVARNEDGFHPTGGKFLVPTF